MSLSFCGIDIACSDLRSPEGEYCVLEVNSNPGLNHYAATGARQAQIVEDLYMQVINIC